MARDSHSPTLTGWPESLERKINVTISEVVGPLELELLSETKEADDVLSSTPSTSSPFKYFLDALSDVDSPPPQFPFTFPDCVLSYDVSQSQYFLFGGRLLVVFVPPPTPQLTRIIRRLAAYNPRDYVFSSFSGNYRIDGRVHHDSGSVGPYYDQEDLATCCAAFIEDEFLNHSDTATHDLVSRGFFRLDHFIAWVLHWADMHRCVAYASIVLLRRLRSCDLGYVDQLSGCHLFLTVFMLASKVLCDRTWNNETWMRIGNISDLRSLNEMERKMCSSLAWNLQVKAEDFPKVPAHIFPRQWFRDQERTS